jgi:hypothetical protein
VAGTFVSFSLYSVALHVSQPVEGGACFSVMSLTQGWTNMTAKNVLSAYITLEVFTLTKAHLIPVVTAPAVWQSAARPLKL